MNTYAPDTEGIDHINAYSKSRTELGRLLSNFTRIPFNCKHGTFASIEAYWYWLICVPSPERESLRHLAGFQAKQRGRELVEGCEYPDSETFEKNIQLACWQKIKASSTLRSLLRGSSLPIVHYYAYGVPPKVTTPKSGGWLWVWYEEARKYLKANPDTMS